jgi:hypothetical protein
LRDLSPVEGEQEEEWKENNIENEDYKEIGDVM